MTMNKDKNVGRLPQPTGPANADGGCSNRPTYDASPPPPRSSLLPRHAFTLIEMLLVIAIFGTAASISTGLIFLTLHTDQSLARSYQRLHAIASFGERLREDVTSAMPSDITLADDDQTLHLSQQLRYRTSGGTIIREAGQVDQPPSVERFVLATGDDSRSTFSFETPSGLVKLRVEVIAPQSSVRAFEKHARVLVFEALASQVEGNR
ncbi:MAG: prepilin-type N-terminal cleavage/methylation domain-containing protein [Alphaproteobacteria bacterium]|nr:prepilin-type N-terminal cleavage/methylation domain-containing protein [Alphaproteobacteria bacterium]